VATLYRCKTPTDRLCPCGRVARELRRAGIECDVVRVAFRRSGRAEVEALSGQDRVPLLLLDGDAICDSKRIVEHLRARR
jgi:glutathione S-transferase